MASPSPSVRTYRIDTLGCKANLYDSRRLAEALEAIGYRQFEDGRNPDVCLVNTCTVTAAADRKCRQRVSHLVREYPQARVFATGCYASAAPQQLRNIPGVAGVYGRQDWHSLLEAINGGPVPGAAELLAGDFGIRSFGGRARAFLKIQEGCDSSCSYCILPRVRGKPRSRPLEELKAEAERLAAAGFREIVLTGIHLGLYGRDLDGRPGLDRPLLAVAETAGVERVRLSSVEANEVDEELLEAMKHPAVCPHLHLPLQSGDAEVLSRMNRPYTPDEFLHVVELARTHLDRPAITTDVMIGFPGETDARFENTLRLCRAARFNRLHVFPFSPRPGTPAATMPDRVPHGVMRERSARLRSLGQEMAAEWAESFMEQQVRVLFERCSAAGRLSGYTDRYVRLTASGSEDLVGRTAWVACEARKGTSLLGRIESARRCAEPSLGCGEGLSQDVA